MNTRTREKASKITSSVSFSSSRTLTEDSTSAGTLESDPASLEKRIQARERPIRTARPLKRYCLMLICRDRLAIFSGDDGSEVIEDGTEGGGSRVDLEGGKF